MSPADLRTPAPESRRSVLAAAAAILCGVALVSILLLAVASPADAAAGALGVKLDSILTFVNDSAAITVSGDSLGTLSPEATIEVMVTGPATLAQVAQTDPALPRAGGMTVTAGSLPGSARLGGSALHLPLPPMSLPAFAGAYRVIVEVRSAGVLLASGGTWMGRVTPRSSPLDLAFVWRAELGIHHDAQGRFFDTAIQEACRPSPEETTSAEPGSGSLAALSDLHSRFPDWHFSLAIEPVLLTQLRDMAEGFTRADGTEAGAQVGDGDPAAKNAKAVISSLAGAAEKDAVEAVTGSYADADPGLLATQGWRDGFAQVQLGKQELSRTLGLALPPSGAMAPGLNLTGGSVGDFGEASIDHVLVDAEVASDLNEKVATGTVATRIHDDSNDRVTLVFADSGLRALVASPWDASRFFAGVAVVLAGGGRDALVLTQGQEFDLPPQSYTDAIGVEIKKHSWIRTQTMAELLRAHPPATRPVLLTREAVEPSGYVAQSIFAAIRDAHACLDDFALGVDPASLSLEDARRSLYIAESRWWTRPGVSPEQANVGLAFATEALAIGKSQLSKIGFAGLEDSMIVGKDGHVKLAIENGGDGVISVELHLSGKGLRFPKGDVMQVKLTPGRNDVDVPVVSLASSPELSARLTLGDTVLGEQSGSIHFITLKDVVPWAGLAVLVIVLLGMIVLLRRRGKKTRARA